MWYKIKARFWWHIICPVIRLYHRIKGEYLEDNARNDRFFDYCKRIVLAYPDQVEPQNPTEHYWEQLTREYYEEECNPEDDFSVCRFELARELCLIFLTYPFYNSREDIE